MKRREKDDRGSRVEKKMEANTIRDTLTPLSEEYRKGTIAELTSS